MRRFLLLVVVATFAHQFSISVAAAQSANRAVSVRQEAPSAANPNRKSATHQTLNREARLAFIRRAQVWAPTDIPNMNLRAGPAGPEAFDPNQDVTCDYTESLMRGATRKFHCRLPDGDIVKVRYGTSNGEVEGSVLATRLLWALGFTADRVYPVRVTCRGCSSDPWTTHGNHGGVHQFDPAVIERKPLGHEMWEDSDKKSGWSWSELEVVDPAAGGAPREQRDALKLLAAFMQHTDTKSEQQRLLCVSDAASGDCEQPFMMLHDVGLTFGHANTFNHNSSGSVNFEEWSQTPVWRDANACIAQLSKSRTGTLGDPRVSEAGRKFLADLLVQLTDQQLHDLFEVARVEQRTDSSNHLSAARVDDWVAVFKQKRDAIVANHCAR